MGGGDGLLFQAFPFTSENHTTMVITGIILTLAIMGGIVSKKGAFKSNRGWRYGAVNHHFGFFPITFS
jgi:hypothetical protein